MRHLRCYASLFAAEKTVMKILTTRVSDAEFDAILSFQRRAGSHNRSAALRTLIIEGLAVTAADDYQPPARLDVIGRMVAELADQSEIERSLAEVILRLSTESTMILRALVGRDDPQLLTAAQSHARAYLTDRQGRTHR